MVTTVQDIEEKDAMECTPCRVNGTRVRVILEHNTTDTEKLIDIIRQLRNEAMTRPGYITGETLVDTDNPSKVLVISTWNNLDDWNAWDKCDTRVEITKGINSLLVEPYTVSIYNYTQMRQNRVWSTF